MPTFKPDFTRPTIPPTTKQTPFWKPPKFSLGVVEITGKVHRLSTATHLSPTIVEKSSGIDPVLGFLLTVHFGEQLRRLRLDRGLSQDALAAAAGVSLATISKAEKNAECRFFGTTAVLVFRALNSTHPLSQKDREWFSRAAKISAYTVEPASNYPPEEESDNPELDTATTYLHRLFEEAGTVKLLSALEALAAAWDIDLPPRKRKAHHSHRQPTGTLPALKQRIQTDGLDATIYTPTGATPPPASPTPTPRTKSA